MQAQLAELDQQDNLPLFSELEQRTRATELHDQVLQNAIAIMCNIEPARTPTLAPDTVDAILTAISDLRRSV